MNLNKLYAPVLLTTHIISSHNRINSVKMNQYHLYIKFCFYHKETSTIPIFCLKNRLFVQSRFSFAMKLERLSNWCHANILGWSCGKWSNHVWLILMTSLKWSSLSPFRIWNYIVFQNSDIETNFELYRSDYGGSTQGKSRSRFTENYPKSGNSPWVKNLKLYSFSWPDDQKLS